MRNMTSYMDSDNERGNYGFTVRSLDTGSDRVIWFATRAQRDEMFAARTAMAGYSRPIVKKIRRQALAAQRRTA